MLAISETKDNAFWKIVNSLTSPIEVLKPFCTVGFCSLGVVVPVPVLNLDLLKVSKTSLNLASTAFNCWLMLTNLTPSTFFCNLPMLDVLCFVKLDTLSEATVKDDIIEFFNEYIAPTKPIDAPAVNEKVLNTNPKIGTNATNAA